MSQEDLVLHENLAPGAPNDCFLYNICSEKQILPRTVNYSRKAISR